MFFDALYPAGLPAGSALLIWTLPDKTSFYARSLYEAQRTVETHCLGADTYYGIGLSPEPSTLAAARAGRPIRKIRPSNTEVTGIPGLWIDLDYVDASAHRKENLPTRETAAAIIDGYDPAPTLVVHSGHGYQAYWLFDEPWMFSGQEARDNAARLTRDFVYAFRAHMQSMGYDADSVIDLARVFRVPGTENHKIPTHPVPVEVVSMDGPRYTVEELRGLTAAIATPLLTTATDKGTSVSVRLDPNANPPADAWHALIETDPRVMASWTRTRTDMTDQSASSYDMSLASYAVAAGWTDQEVADLLIASRRRHGDDLKVDRDDYYPRTIARARAGTGYTMRGIVEVAAMPTEQSTELVNARLGLDIRGITKYMADPPVYVLHIGHNGELREVTLGSVDSILSQKIFGSRVAGAINRIVPGQSGGDWQKTAQALLNLVVEEALPEATPGAMARAWTREYLADVRPSDDWEQACLLGRPFIKDGRPHIVLRGMMQWLRISRGEKTATSRDVARYLSQAGAVGVAVFIKANVERPSPTTRHAFDVAPILE